MQSRLRVKTAYPNGRTATLKEMTMASVPFTPYEELGLLVSKLGGQRPVAHVLGKQPKLIWTWLRNRPALQRDSVQMIHDTFVVVSALSSARSYEPTDLRFLLETEWPSLGQRSPLTLIKEGKLDSILEVVQTQATDVASTDTESSAWKADAFEELEASLRSRSERVGDPFEDYVFVMGMTDEEVDAFAVEARGVLDQVELAEEWESFLDHYWGKAPSVPASASVAIDEVIADEGIGANRLSIGLGDLLVHDRALSPRRASREAVPA
jgi:hypothetical protein